MAILAISIGALSSSFATTNKLSHSTARRDQALEAVISVIEEMRGVPPSEVFLRYNGTTLDDPPGVVSPGNHFSIEGFETVPGDPDGFVGDILFPGDGIQLLENVVDPELGMSRDLNADENIDGLDHALDYTILPFRVRVRWEDESGQQSLDVVYVLTSR